MQSVLELTTSATYLTLLRFVYALLWCQTVYINRQYHPTSVIIWALVLLTHATNIIHMSQMICWCVEFAKIRRYSPGLTKKDILLWTYTQGQEIQDLTTYNAEQNYRQTRSRSKAYFVAKEPRLWSGLTLAELFRSAVKKVMWARMISIQWKCDTIRRKLCR